MDFEVVHIDSSIIVIANNTIGVLYRSRNAVAVLPITPTMIARQAGQPPSAPSPPRNPLNTPLLAVITDAVLFVLLSDRR